MNRDARNRPDTGPDHTLGHPQSTLASMLAPLRVERQRVDDGFALRMTPLRGVDALRVLAEWSPAQHPITLVGGRLPLGGLDDARRATVLLGDDAFTVPDLRLLREMAYAVRVDGPVEPRDALAIDRAIRRGDDPLSAEVRATSAVVDTDHDSVLITARSERPLHAVVADALRGYLEAFGSSQVGVVTAPDPDLISSMLAVSGSLTVRPIETEFYRSFVDIGISSQGGTTSRPANQSLIYDVITKTWHGD